MLEKPEDEDALIVSSVQETYGLRVLRLEFLPLGADANTAAFRLDSANGEAYFLKLRSGEFDSMSVAVPRFLRDSGIHQVMTPIAAADGQLTLTLAMHQLILYPFVNGRNAIEAPLAEEQWVEFGSALRRVHDSEAPTGFSKRVSREQFSPHWRGDVRRYLARPPQSGDDSVAADTTAVLRIHRNEIEEIVDRADELSSHIRCAGGAFVLCHGDIHAWNVLTTDDGGFLIVDWDTLVFAPRERDLMFIGSGIGGVWHTRNESSSFYEGYGPIEIDQAHLAYYRYERIVQDIAEFCEEIYRSTVSTKNRRQALGYFEDHFKHSRTVSIAHETYSALG